MDVRTTLLAWLLVSLKGVPRWRDRFVQYGIKVSFWGSETLKNKIVKSTSKITRPRNDVFGWMIIIPPSGVGVIN